MEVTYDAKLPPTESTLEPCTPILRPLVKRALEAPTRILEVSTRKLSWARLVAFWLHLDVPRINIFRDAYAPRKMRYAFVELP